MKETSGDENCHPLNILYMYVCVFFFLTQWQQQRCPVFSDFFITQRAQEPIKELLHPGK